MKLFIYLLVGLAPPPQLCRRLEVTGYCLIGEPEPEPGGIMLFERMWVVELWWGWEVGVGGLG